jgi:hypothetical protein
MAKNYYAILGVSPTANFDEIRSAYRQRSTSVRRIGSGRLPGGGYSDKE